MTKLIAINEKIENFKKEYDSDYWIINAINDLRLAESKLRDLDDLERETECGEKIEIRLYYDELELVIKHRMEQVENMLMNRDKTLSEKYGGTI